ncbi:hypothetical protein XBKB1_3260004 [Xenorhabdus bovienii str. kraussei Becker Underwood]|uniref:Uncharacterized protein n=1 Tax=Xenorhabdus bovienii str. kraussei Becker Underwood TaxID=1398204 RepID=A0A077PYJ5_XENBV|nr:hypothetical protein XBKB1_3260004 [Xenorhabdus bovienii str. kraussei Becker Underwood]
MLSLSGIRDRHDNRITFHYDDLHDEGIPQLAQITHSDGYRLLLDYDQHRLSVQGIAGLIASGGQHAASKALQKASQLLGGRPGD